MLNGRNPNVAARLAERASLDPERPAIVEYRGGRARRTSFGELRARVEALAAGFRARGIGAGDGVLLFVPMSADLYVALLATMHAGATAVFVDAWADRRRLDAAVAAARPRAFVGTPRAHLLRIVSPAVRRIPLHFVAGRGFLSMDRHARPDSVAPAAEVRADDAALVTLTTGSTGRPKAAARSHAFLWAQHRALAAHLGLVETDVDMPTLPVFVLNNLALGVTSVIPSFDPRRPAEIDPAAVFRQMEAEGVTTSSGSPSFYARLCRWCQAEGRTLPLRALFTGGAPVLPPLARLMERTTQGEAHVVYGSTEAEPIAGISARGMLDAMQAASDGSDQREPPEGICVGPPVDQIDLKLVTPTDGPIELGPGGWGDWVVEPGDVGEVVVTGTHVLRGYLDDPDADRENKVRDGDRVWHRTGDAARLDADGRLWLMGRIGGRVRRAGETWWSTPAEVRALEVPGVAHAAYLGLPDAELGQRAVLCIEPSADAGADADELREGVRVALRPIPTDEVRIISRIPRDPRHASKTDTEVLRRMLGG